MNCEGGLWIRVLKEDCTVKCKLVLLPVVTAVAMSIGGNDDVAGKM